MPGGILFLIIEIIGTAAFAISGALAAIGGSLDIFGVVFIGCITACGGGVVRDLLIGNIPPAIFTDFFIFAVAAITSLTVFTVSYIKRKSFPGLREKTERINNIFDAIGLAAFSVMGCEAAMEAGFSQNGFLVTFMGMLTGIGGGIMRDLLLDDTPYVLKKHVYALASILGSMAFYLIRKYHGSDVFAIGFSMGLVVALRLLATKYRWELPKIKFE